MDTVVEVTKMNYEKKTLDLLNLLSNNVDGKFVIDKTEDGNIMVSCTSPDATIFYKFVCPSEHFSFTDDEIAFYNYTNFHELINELDRPVLEQDDNKIIMKTENSEITYQLSDSEIIRKDKVTLPFSNPDFEFNLTEEQLNKIKSMIKKVNADYVKLTVDDSKVNVRLFSPEHSNSFTQSFDVTNNTKNQFYITTDEKFWTKAPKGNFNVYVKEEGVIKLEYQTENKDVMFEIYGSMVDED